MQPTPEGLFAAARARDAARPLITFYDDATGERQELSAASLGNWVAKTHFLLGDELGLGVGDRAHVNLPLHWMSYVVLFGAWSAGLEVVTDPTAADVAFTDEPGIAAAVGAGEVYALALAPWGQGFSGPAPDGASDFVAAVRPQADAWAGVRFAATGADPALDGVSRADLVAAAQARAGELGLAEGARVLLGDPAPHAVDVPTLLAPFTVGGTMVLLRHAPATGTDRRVAQEHVTVVV